MKSTMPTTVYEREDVSPVMHSALRVYILREKEKRKQEAAEAEKIFEKRVKEEEEKRKKKEEELSTIEDIKEQLATLNQKLVGLRQEKHQFFHKFKRLLNDENLKKNLKNQREQQCDVQSATPIPSRYHPSPVMNTQGQMVMSPGRSGIHYGSHHMSPQSSTPQSRKLSDQHSGDDSLTSQIRNQIAHQSSKSPQIAPSYSLSMRHTRSPSGGRIRSDIDQSSYQDLMQPQMKVPRLK